MEQLKKPDIAANDLSGLSKNTAGDYNRKERETNT